MILAIKRTNKYVNGQTERSLNCPLNYPFSFEILNSFAALKKRQHIDMNEEFVFKMVSKHAKEKKLRWDFPFDKFISQGKGVIFLQMTVNELQSRAD